MREREAVRIAPPDAGRLVVRRVDDRIARGLTGAVSGKRDARRLTAALRDDTPLPSGVQLPDVGERERHQITRVPVVEHVVALAGDTVPEIVSRDAVDAWFRTGRDARVARTRVGRQVVHLGVRKPGAALAQFRQRGQHARVTIEVVGTHPVEDEKEDGSRWRCGGPDARQNPSRRRSRHRDTERGRDRDGHVLLHGGHGIHAWRHANASEQHRNAAVIGPRRSVHVGHAGVGARQDVALARHDQNLPGAAREIPAREPRQELRAVRRNCRRRPG